MSVTSQYPQFANCICRLMSVDDFKAFVESLRTFSALADTHAIMGCGEQGQTAKGVAQAYRKILEMIDSAKPNEDQFGSPGDTLDPTSRNYRGQAAPPP